MLLSDADRLARQLMAEWLDPNTDGHWSFGFDRAKKRFGVCIHSPRRRIQLSAYLVNLNDDARVRDTILHEIAHAKAGHRAGHGRVWKLWAIKVGAPPRRCYDDTNTTSPAARWHVICGACGEIVSRRHRRSRASLSRRYHNRCGVRSMGTLRMVPATAAA